jgi:hypothetical protein
VEPDPLLLDESVPPLPEECVSPVADGSGPDELDSEGSTEPATP